MRRFAFPATLLVLSGLAVITAVHAQNASEPAPAAPPAAGEAPVFVMPKSGPFTPETVAIPNAKAISAWARSGHADAASDAFRHWDDEGAVPANCAVCHSGAGFRAFHGLDGGPAGIREQPFALGGVVDCETCHSPGLSTITEIALPSGVVHPVTGADASCTTCHSGRASGLQVTTASAGKADDAPNPELRFINPHYNIAAATNLGSYGGAGYQYPGKTYSGRFNHAKPVATCVSCHDPHQLTIAEENCLTCHEKGDPDAIRISRQSHDGSGDITKGIKADIEANAALLMSLITDYARDVAGKALVYDGGRHPYFFADANGDGRADEADGKRVAYDAFTPRLLKAAFNWKVIDADPGIHVHNPHYALELLYDSIEDLAGSLDRDMSAFNIAR